MPKALKMSVKSGDTLMTTVKKKKPVSRMKTTTKPTKATKPAKMGSY